MTIGDKIKYCRKHFGMTQRELAELSGIHPVSIRKYETNKMTPQPEQLRKIAKALGISYVALQGVRETGLELETLGDLYGTLMALIDANIFRLDGDRPRAFRISDDSYRLFLNPLMDDYLEFETEDHKTIPLSQLNIKIKDQQLLTDLLDWERNITAVIHSERTPDGHLSQSALELWSQTEVTELDDQMKSVLLDTSNGVQFRAPQGTNPLQKSENRQK